MSTRQLTDSNSLVTDTYTYDAFGLLLNRSGATENNYMYTGEQYDPNVGFYYLRARYYNQSNGRFLTMDTWAGSMFEPASLHKYLYCAGNPVGNWDPSGEFNLYSTSGGLIALGTLMFAMTLLAEVSLVGWGYLMDWLIDASIPVEWTGSFKIGGISIGLPNPYTGNPNIVSAGINYIHAHLEGSRKTSKGIEYGMGNYIIIVFGPSIGGLFSSSEASGKVNTPGLLGTNPKILTGSVVWSSVSYVTESINSGSTTFYMGFGYGTVSNEFGYNIGISLIEGVSFLTGSSYWYKPK